jgi:hypothetical protein
MIDRIRIFASREHGLRRSCIVRKRGVVQADPSLVIHHALS